MNNTKYEYEFCMAQFKPAIVGLTIMLVLILGWSAYHCTRHPHMNNLKMVAAVAPPAPKILAKDKMLHPYWGNCNKCHITVAPAKPISQVMAGAPISIKDKMIHDYWGNCVLCHVVTDGFQDPNAKKATGAKQVAFNQDTTPESIGLQLQTVTGHLMAQMGLANEDGLLVLNVAPESVAEAAGFKKGDEIIRVGRVRLDSINDFSRALSMEKPGSTVTMVIYRGTKRRNLYCKLRGNSSAFSWWPIAATAPMTQNQIETLAEQLGVPKTAQAVKDALRKQKQQKGAAPGNTRNVAAAAPMTQNQVETLAEQLGVPKTAQAVQDALRKQKQQKAAAPGNTRPVAAAAPMTQNRVETLAEQLGVPKTAQAVQDALRKQKQAQQQPAQVAGALNLGKVAVASAGQTIQNHLAPLFGKSPYFIVYDPVPQTYSVVTNPNVNDQFGHGIQTAQFMVDLQVSNIIASSFTQEALNTLHDLRVNVFQGVTGTVQDVLTSYIAGRLIPSNRVSLPGTTPSIQARAPYTTATPGIAQTIY